MGRTRYVGFSKDFCGVRVIDPRITVEDLILKMASETRFRRDEVEKALIEGINSVYELDDEAAK